MVSSLRVTALKKAFRPNQLNLRAGRNPTVMVNGVIFPLSQTEYLNLANYVYRQRMVLNRLRNEENARRRAVMYLQSNRNRMLSGILYPTNTEYRRILGVIFTNVHTMMRPFPTGQEISAARPLWRFTSVLPSGAFESFSNKELKYHQRRYRQLFMNTPLIRATENKRQRILNILSNERLSRNAAVNAAIAEYYARNPRSRNL